MSSVGESGGAMSDVRERLLVVLAVGLIAGAIADTRLGVPEAQGAPTPNRYTLVQALTTATFNRMVDFALIPGTTDEAVVVRQQEARVRRGAALSGLRHPRHGNFVGTRNGG